MTTGLISGATALLGGVLLTTTAMAADLSTGPAPRSRDVRPVGAYSTYSPLGPACYEHAPYDANLLRCPPQVQVRPPEADVLAWNDLVRVRPQRKPYNELFSWSP